MIEINIGNVNDRICSANTVKEEFGCALTQNRDDYWFSIDDLDISGKIAKSSDEGALLHKFIRHGEPSKSAIESHLLGLCLKRFTNEQFLEIIEAARSDARKVGRNDLRQELGDLLTLE